MTLLEFINDTLIPATVAVFSMADTVLQMLSSLKLFGISFTALAFTVAFITLIFYRTVDHI